MIRSVSKLPNTAFYSAVYTKISALFKAYGSKYTFCIFWEQVDNSDNITAIICKYYSALTIYLENSADITELSEFANSLGFSEILSNQKLFSDSIRFNGVNKACGFKGEFDYHININSARECYNVLNQHKDNINLPEFDSWYVDISHRIRHKAAIIKNIDNASLVCLIGNNTALLNGIAVDLNYKSKGMGKRLLQDFIDNAPIKDIFAICTDEVVGFYLSCGFKTTEYIYLHKGKC